MTVLSTIKFQLFMSIITCHSDATNLDLIEAYINENKWSYDHIC
jgi:hypothetical protein